MSAKSRDSAGCLVSRLSSEPSGLGVGAYGDFQGNYSHAIDETMFLRFNGAVGLEEQTGASTDIDVRGTIGLGWKY